MKKILVMMICFVLIFTVIPKIIRMKRHEQEPEFVLTYAENQPEDYPTTLGEKTDGRIKIIVQADGILGDERTVIKQIMFGGIDFARVSLTTLSDTIPKLNVLQLPYLYTSSIHMWNVLEGDIGDEFLSSFQGTDIVALSWYDAGARSFYSSKQIRTLDDLKGLRIRVQESELMTRMIEELGATAVPMVYDDVYSALETGKIDAAENNWPSYEATGHYLVSKNFTLDEHCRIPEVQVCGQSTWSKLSEEDQNIILECARESAIYERNLWLKKEKESEKIALENGVKIVNLTELEKSRFREAVIDVYEEFCSEYMDIVEKIIAVDK